MSAAQKPTNGSPLRILVVDDNCDAAETTGQWLRIRGFEAETVTDSAQCMSRLASFSPHVLLLDIAMPQISGYDLAKRIRSQAGFDGLVILAISGYGDAKHAQLSIEAGCDQHLTKPVDLTTLETIISDAVGKSR